MRRWCSVLLWFVLFSFGSSAILPIITKHEPVSAAPEWLSDTVDLSTLLDSFCGEEVGFELAGALAGTGYWYHIHSETHWFILDLGSSYNLTAMKGRSLTDGDPTSVDLYVSDDVGDWGAAVASGVDTWQDTDVWQEVDTADKIGRYVKVEVTTCEDDHNFAWGGLDPFFTIFDVYGEIYVIPDDPPENSAPFPVNGSGNQSLNPKLEITVADPDLDDMNVTFRTNATGVWGTIGTNASVPDGTYRWTNSSMNGCGKKYWWNVSTNDGMGEWDNDTYTFTTIIFTSVNTISPYSTSTNPLTITATGISSLNNVTLYYRNSTDNVTWNPSNTQITWALSDNHYDSDGTFSNIDYLNKAVVMNAYPYGGIRPSTCVFAYTVSLDDNCLTIINATKQWQQTELAHFHFGTQGHDIKIVDYAKYKRIAYVVSYDTGAVYAVNVTNPAGMATLDSSDDCSGKGMYLDIDATNNLLYLTEYTIGAGGDYLHAYNITNPNDVKWKCKVALPRDQPWTPYVNTNNLNYLYAAGGSVNGSIAIVNVTWAKNISAPSMKVIKTQGYGMYGDICQGGNYLYGSSLWKPDGVTLAKEFMVWDVSTPTNLTNVSRTMLNTYNHLCLWTSSSGHQYAITRHYNNLGVGDYGVNIVDLADKSHPVNIGYIPYIGIRIQDMDKCHWMQVHHNNVTNQDVLYVIGYNQNSWVVFNLTYWNKWTSASNPDLASPWSWSFNFPNGTGYYQFYSIGQKAGFLAEYPPSTKDAMCKYTASGIARVNTQIFNRYLYCGNTSVRSNAQIFNKWFYCGNESIRANAQIFNRWLYCGNNSSRINLQVFNRWLQCGNNTVRNNIQVFNRWLYCGNNSIRANTQIFNRWLYCGNDSSRINAEIFNRWLFCGNDSIRINTQIFNRWLYCRNDTVRSNNQVFNKWLSCGNDSVRINIQVFNRWLYCGNGTILTNTQVFNLWLRCGNDSVRNNVQIFNRWLYCGNNTVRGNTQVFNRWLYCGNNSIRTNIMVFNRWLLCGNGTVLTNTQIFNHWLYCGNDTSRTNAQIFNRWFYCGNNTIRFNTQVFNRWLYCGNATVRANAQVFNRYLYCGNDSSRVNTQAFHRWLYCGNDSTIIVRVNTKIFDKWLICGNYTDRTNTQVFNRWLYCGNTTPVSGEIIITSATPNNTITPINMILLKITIHHTNGNLMNLQWSYNNTIGTWITLNNLTGIGNGTYGYYPTGIFPFTGITYQWRITANSTGSSNVTQNYSFTTGLGLGGGGGGSSQTSYGTIGLIGIFGLIGFIYALRKRKKK